MQIRSHNRAFICVLTVLCLGLSASVSVAQELTSTLTFWQQGDPGEQLNLRGRVINEQGEPIPNAEVALRQADGSGNYTPRYSGVLITDDRGTFSVATAVPGQYTSTKHIHVRIAHEDYPLKPVEFVFTGDPNIAGRAPNSIEVVLETVTSDGKQRSIGGVEVVLTK